MSPSQWPRGSPIHRPIAAAAARAAVHRHDAGVVDHPPSRAPRSPAPGGFAGCCCTARAAGLRATPRVMQRSKRLRILIGVRWSVRRRLGAPRCVSLSARPGVSAGILAVRRIDNQRRPPRLDHGLPVVEPPHGMNRTPRSGHRPAARPSGRSSASCSYATTSSASEILCRQNARAAAAASRCDSPRSLADQDGRRGSVEVSRLYLPLPGR